ncbi:MAG: SDR family oxidoreductase, partial [Pseudomonadota bacterium]
MGVLEDMRLVVLGCGYSARAFVDLMTPASVVGTTRSEDRAASLRALGIEPVVVTDGTTPALDHAIKAATHIIVSAAPGPQGDPFLPHLSEAFSSAAALTWVGYLSTIGVYGDYQGGAVDEEAETRAQSDRGRWRIAAEAAWMAFGKEQGVPVGVFRLAGIYGPGRNTFVALRDGRAKRIIKPGQVFNRIHVSDIAATLKAASTQAAGGIFNVADNEPAPPEEVVTFAAKLMGVEPPPRVPFDEAQMSPMARSFYGEVKRIINARIRSELGVILTYPTYREGLTTLWQDN